MIPPDYSRIKILFIPNETLGTYQLLNHGIIDGFRHWGAEVFIASSKDPLIDLCLLLKPDLLFALQGDKLPAAALNKLHGMGVPTAAWFVDDPYYIDTTTTYARLFQYVFTQEISCLAWYELQGVRHVRYLPMAFDPTMYFPDSAPAEPELDFVLVGTAWQSRLDFVDSLADYFRRKRALFVGPGWERLQSIGQLKDQVITDILSHREIRRLYHAGRIAINLHRNPDCQLYYQAQKLGLDAHSPNPKVFEIGACRTLQFCDLRRDLSRFYRIGQEIAVFKTPYEFVQQAEYYLANRQIRADMIERSVNRTLAEHTYRARMRQVLDAVFSPSEVTTPWPSLW